MAINTSSTTADLRLTEHLAERALEESRPKQVAVNLCNLYSIAGTGSKTFKANRYGDTGQGVAGVEGTAFSLLTSLSTTAQSVTPAENSIAQFLTTNDDIETRAGSGITNASDLFASGNLQAMLNALMPETRQGLAMNQEKTENDVTSLYTSLSNSVSDSGNVMTLGDFDAAIIALEMAEDLPHEDFVASLDKRTWSNLRTDMQITSGGVAGVLWGQQDRPFVPEQDNGFRMRLLGVDVYTHGNGVRQTSGSDAISAMFLRGIGAPEYGDGGQPGCFMLVQGRPDTVSVEKAQRERGVEVQFVSKVTAAERVDNWGVKLLFKAAAA